MSQSVNACITRRYFRVLRLGFFAMSLILQTFSNFSLLWAESDNIKIFAISLFQKNNSIIKTSVSAAITRTGILYVVKSRDNEIIKVLASSGLVFTTWPAPFRTLESLLSFESILSSLWESMISGKVHFIVLYLYSFKTFGVLYFNFSSIYVKVEYFVAGVNISGQYFIKRFYLFLVYTQWFQVLWAYFEIFIPKTSDPQGDMEVKKYLYRCTNWKFV